jgi:hypothetical protein
MRVSRGRRRGGRSRFALLRPRFPALVITRPAPDVQMVRVLRVVRVCAIQEILGLLNDPAQGVALGAKVINIESAGRALARASNALAHGLPVRSAAAALHSSCPTQ